MSTCHKEITREDLRYCQTGIMYYDITFDDKGQIEYEQDEFVSGENGEFFHQKCGGEALDDRELRRLWVKYIE